MYTIKMTPRFSDTDALGHINNASFLNWFEAARRPIFEIFIPSLSPKDWNLIIAKVDLEFLAQTYYQDDVEIQTSLIKVGNSSFTIKQDCVQNGSVTCSSQAILVHFDYSTNKSLKIPDHIRKKLESL
ncbi:MAG: thioesterase [Halobacteriovorax sp.]|nr:thioesterase [Halobacteriovorax sp.]